MNISINEKYFEKIVHKMEMDYIKNSDSFKSYYKSKLKDKRDAYKKDFNRYTSLEYLKENRGLIDYEPALRYKGSYKAIINDILIRSLYYCPIDTGALKKSVKSYAYGDMYFIRYDKEYAHYVHELLNNAHYAPTRAKYLEDAAMDICNHNNALWIKNEVPVIVYICYYPLYIFITPTPKVSNDAEVLFSNYEQVQAILKERYDHTNNNYDHDFILNMYNKYLNGELSEDEISDLEEKGIIEFNDDAGELVWIGDEDDYDDSDELEDFDDDDTDLDSSAAEAFRLMGLLGE
jgi:hypothetical protein